jgi:hypothetical protein
VGEKMKIAFVAPGFGLMLNVLKEMLLLYPNITQLYMSEIEKSCYSDEDVSIPVTVVKELDDSNVLIGIENDTIIVGVMSP